mmetsp:Transcript_61907/g.130739  ORF Transcript_61907/g.130739 Transcript_61907/m.130739 type:complete len:217 (+) Transcript_61907:157-807(+)
MQVSIPTNTCRCRCSHSRSNCPMCLHPSWLSAHSCSSHSSRRCSQHQPCASFRSTPAEAAVAAGAFRTTCAPSRLSARATRPRPPYSGRIQGLHPLQLLPSGMLTMKTWSGAWNRNWNWKGAHRFWRTSHCSPGPYRVFAKTENKSSLLKTSGNPSVPRTCQSSRQSMQQLETGPPLSLARACPLLYNLDPNFSSLPPRKSCEAPIQGARHHACSH